MKTKWETEKKENLKRLIRKCISMALVMGAAFLLTGCGGTKLSADFDEEKVKTAAQEAIGYLIAGE